MNELQYVSLVGLDPDARRILMNKKIRQHLIQHKLFDSDTIKQWIREKCVVDHTVGFRVRGIIANNELAGWCGIQLEDGKCLKLKCLETNSLLTSLHQVVFEQLNPVQGCANITVSWSENLNSSEIYYV